MRFFKGKLGRRTIRHIVIVFVLCLLVGAVGLAAIDVTNKLSSVPLSRQTANYLNAESSKSLATLPPVSSESSSEISSSQASSSSSVKTSTLPYSSVASSKPPVSSKPSTPPPPPMDPAIYQAMYPDMFVQKPQLAAPEQGKIVYLTFDDGPSNLTMPLLNVLDKYKVKATFFLCGKTGPQDLNDMKEIVARGHAIGVHSYTHRLPQIYKNPAAFLDDFAEMHDLILKTTGVDTHIYRYAGGSTNGYNKYTAKDIINEMNRRGYTYFDWNVSSGDAEVGTTAAQIYNNVIRGVHAHGKSVILCHNTGAKGNTLAQMPRILETLLKEGYVFKTLDETVDNTPYIFRVPK